MKMRSLGFLRSC